MKPITDLDNYFDTLSNFKKECNVLRKLLLSSGLDETIKWGSPVYTFNGKNVIGLASFKSYAGLWFFKGVALKDELNVLVKGSDKTHTQKQWRFNNMADINKAHVANYIQEAILIEQNEIRLPNPKPITIDPLLLTALDTDRSLKDAWELLSKSCKREYIDYINEAKKVETKLSRIEKSKSMIFSGRGLHDKYR
jgi:uncharacterized protein YdeI (YjbR/CyaY-like superfamily)